MRASFAPTLILACRRKGGNVVQNTSTKLEGQPSGEMSTPGFFFLLPSESSILESNTPRVDNFRWRFFCPAHFWRSSGVEALAMVVLSSAASVGRAAANASDVDIPVDKSRSRRSQIGVFVSGIVHLFGC